MGTERFVDLIQKKKNGETLTKEEIDFMITDYVAGKIPDYQMSAMLMAIYFNGMENEELAAFTLAMRDSGDLVDLSPIEGIKVDKHSTGGVGDKTTLIVGPIVAACGVPVAKMSGRGLGFTGGTLDKLESISGFRIDLSAQEFFETVKKTGISVIGQTGNLAPADKLLYALHEFISRIKVFFIIVKQVVIGTSISLVGSYAISERLECIIFINVVEYHCLSRSKSCDIYRCCGILPKQGFRTLPFTGSLRELLINIGILLGILVHDGQEEVLV